jgi:hypothetical protein
MESQKLFIYFVDAHWRKCPWVQIFHYYDVLKYAEMTENLPLPKKNGHNRASRVKFFYEIIK